VVDEGLSGGCGGDRPRTASSMSLGSLEMESLAMTEHTHKRRAIQVMTSRVVNTKMKMVGASAMKAIGASIVYILVKRQLSGGVGNETNK
jgi:hypothetical protein